MTVESIKTGRGEFEVRIPLSLLTGVPAQAMAAIHGLTRDYVDLAAQYVAGQINEHAPKNTGLLGQSFISDPAGPQGGIELLGGDTGDVVGRVFSTLPYAIVMDEGRRPGFPVSRAGITAIALWVRRKLGLSGREALSATYAIAWSIREHGLAARHFVDAGLASAQPNLDQVFSLLSNAISERLTQGGAA